MARIADFHCTYDNASGFGTWAEEDYGILFPNAYTEREMMVKLALGVKEHNGAAVCLLPFCHTLEAEVLGGNIRLGDGVTGPRTGGYCCKTLEEVLALPGVEQAYRGIFKENGNPDTAEGKKTEEHPENRGKVHRLAETLEACRILKRMGEDVVFLVSGPLTILNGLADSEMVFRALIREPELVERVLEKIGRDILTVMKLAEDAGVGLISFADPSGGVNIVGPKVAGRMAQTFTAGFLKEADRILRPETTVLLCPKTAFALIGTEMAEWKDHVLPEPMEYTKAILYKKKEIRFAGQDCMNHVGHVLADGKLKELVLK